MDKTDKLLWMYMIQNGSINKKWSYYGGHYESHEGDEQKNFQLYNDVLDIGVDWKKTQPVREDRNSEFIDTFADADSWVSVLEGTLFLENGKNYWIGTTESAPEILKVMNAYIGDPFEQSLMLTNEEVNTVRRTIALLSSMVNGGECHSPQSTVAVNDALDILTGK